MGNDSKLDEVREKIADWYGAHYDADHDFFYEKNDLGVQSDEDEAAMDAYRGAVWMLEALGRGVEWTAR